MDKRFKVGRCVSHFNGSLDGGWALSRARGGLGRFMGTGARLAPGDAVAPVRVDPSVRSQNSCQLDSALSSGASLAAASSFRSHRSPRRRYGLPVAFYVASL